MTEDINYMKNVRTVFGIIGWFILSAIVQAYLAPITEVKIGKLVIIENWGWGLIGFSCFAILYIIPSKQFLFRFKKLWFILMIVSTCWIAVDWADFVIAIGTFNGE